MKYCGYHWPGIDWVVLFFVTSWDGVNGLSNRVLESGCNFCRILLGYDGVSIKRSFGWIWDWGLEIGKREFGRSCRRMVAR